MAKYRVRATVWVFYDVWWIDDNIYEVDETVFARNEEDAVDRLLSKIERSCDPDGLSLIGEPRVDLVEGPGSPKPGTGVQIPLDLL